MKELEFICDIEDLLELYWGNPDVNCEQIVQQLEEALINWRKKHENQSKSSS